MRKSVWLAVVLTFALTWAAESYVQPRVVTCGGEGSVDAEPDMANVVLGVSLEDPGAAAAYARCNKAMDKVIAAAEKLGVARADIRTVQLDLAPKVEFPETGTSRMKGFVMNHLIRIRVRDLSRVSNVIDEATSAGANRIDGVSFTFKEIDSLKSEARSRALDNARDRAEDLADGAGVKLGKLYSINETSYDMYSDEISAGRALGGVSAMPGTQSVKVSVFVTFEIQ